jgi:predicted PurR-regulated permease PerM
MRTEGARSDAAHGGERMNEAPPGPTSTRSTTPVAVAAVLLIAWWLVGKVLLVLVAGVLAAIALSAFTDWLMARGIPRRGLALAIVVFGNAAALGATGWLLAPEISAQTDELMQQLPQAWQSLLASLQRWGWGRALTQPPAAQESLAVVSNATGMLGAGLHSVGLLAIVVFLGFYLAADPEPYRRGLLRLLPPGRRGRAKEVLEVIGNTLQRWLLSRLFAMFVVGSATALGLWLLQIQLALTLGLLSGILTFIPYLGPIVSAVPAALLALTQGWVPAAYVIALYVGIHILEGYLITPLIEQQAVRLPPGVSIAAQVILWTLAGVWGLALASPIAATLLVLVNMLYIEDQLGETAAVPTNGDA